MTRIHAQIRAMLMSGASIDTKLFIDPASWVAVWDAVPEECDAKMKLAQLKGLPWSVATPAPSPVAATLSPAAAPLEDDILDGLEFDLEFEFKDVVAAAAGSSAELSDNSDCETYSQTSVELRKAHRALEKLEAKLDNYRHGVHKT